MPSQRSWTTVAATIGLAWIAPGLSSLARAEEPITNQVQLQIQVAGLRTEGCYLTIKPAHPGCRFKPIQRHIPGTQGGTFRLETLVIPATSLNPDRDCMFAITLVEPGMPPRTYQRGLVLVPPSATEPRPVRTLSVNLNTPSLALRDSEATRRR
jgi:hypothetical protein